jgi:hypothetical protein
MHIWNIKSVTEEINGGQMTETKAFGYLFLTLSINSLNFLIASYAGIPSPLSRLPFGFVVPLLTMAIFFSGMIITFRAFQANHGTEFVLKFMCLILPANIRALVFCLPLYLIAAAIAFQYSMPDRHLILAQLNSVIIMIMNVVLFIILYRNMLLVSPMPANVEEAGA